MCTYGVQKGWILHIFTEISSFINSNSFLLCWPQMLPQVHYNARCRDHLNAVQLHSHVCDAHGRHKTQLIACWWPDCSGLVAHWAVIATAGASGIDFCRTPIAQSWHLPLSTVCPDQPLTMPFCPDRWKGWGLKLTYIFFHWYLLSFLSRGSSINHSTFHLFTLCFYLLLCPVLQSLSMYFLSSFHPPGCFNSNTHFCFFNPASLTLPPSALPFTFTYLDRFHLRGNNPLTGSFRQMTSSNPFVAVGWINPVHSLLSPLWRHKSSWFKESKGVQTTIEKAPGKESDIDSKKTGGEGKEGHRNYLVTSCPWSKCSF